MKIFVTKLEHDNNLYEGPSILAEDFKNAQAQIDTLNQMFTPNVNDAVFVLIGALSETVIEDEDSWNRVLH